MLIFREMDEKDLTDIFALEQSIFSDAWSMDALAETFRQEHSLILLVEEDGKIRGYCILYYVLDEGDVARIAVDKTTRRSGVGYALLEETWSICEHRGIRKITLEVRESNQAAVGLYKKHGFRAIAVRKDYYHNPMEDGFIMVKKIM